MVVADQFCLNHLEQLIGLTSDNADIDDSQEEGNKEGMAGFHNVWAMIDSLDENAMRMGALFGLSARQYSIVSPSEQPCINFQCPHWLKANPRPMISLSGMRCQRRLERHHSFP